MAALPPSSTTRTLELANNTSTYDGYCQLSQPFYINNPTPPPQRILDHFQAGCPDVNKNEMGHVSHADHHTLLYPGSTTLITAHFMPWFEHTKFHSGYQSNTVAQVQKQVADAKARGIDGFITDYYTKYESVMLKLRDECERRGDFWFAHDVDQGIFTGVTPANKQSTLISVCNAIAANHFTSPRYIRMRYTGTKWVQDQVNGRPILLFFGMDNHKADLDWVAARAAFNGNPLLLFRNSGAYTGSSSDGVSDGAYAWLGPSTVYAKAATYPTKLTIGSAAKGFWDDGASWGDARYTAQNNGKFWLSQWALLAQYFSASFELPIMQIVTWNDYEEGTSAEHGIANHITLPVTLTGASLAWSVSGGGGIETVDSFVVYASPDGENLSLLASLPITQQTYDLAAFGLPAGTYKVFVLAIGKPGIHNKLSSSVDYTVATPVNPPIVTIDSTVPSPATGLAPLAVTFNATATAVGPKTISTLAWDFGDGATAATEDTSHTYTAPGTYTATLVATDSGGVQASASVVITATEVPTPPPPDPDDTDESIPKDPLDPSRPICSRWRKRKTEVGEQQ